MPRGERPLFHREQEAAPDAAAPEFGQHPDGVQIELARPGLLLQDGEPGIGAADHGERPVAEPVQGAPVVADDRSGRPVVRQRHERIPIAVLRILHPCDLRQHLQEVLNSAIRLCDLFAHRHRHGLRDEPGIGGRRLSYCDLHNRFAPLQGQRYEIFRECRHCRARPEPRLRSPASSERAPFDGRENPLFALVRSGFSVGIDKKIPPQRVSF